MTEGESAAGRRPLDGLGVVLTRPAAQAEPVAASLREAGATVIVFPTLEIVGTPLSAASEAALSTLAEASLAIFVSANAAEHGLAAAAARGPWPATVRAATVGQATAQRLRAAGLPDVIAPTERFDSESLLALIPDSLVAGRRVLIFRGVGGREHLRTALEARGAQVAYVECYRRVRPSTDASRLREAIATGRVDAAQAMSAEALANLVDMAGADLPWQRVALVVPHPAIAASPHAARFGRALVVEGSGAPLIESLSRLRQAA